MDKIRTRWQIDRARQEIKEYQKLLMLSRVVLSQMTWGQVYHDIEAAVTRGAKAAKAAEQSIKDLDLELEKGHV